MIPKIVRYVLTLHSTAEKQGWSWPDIFKCTFEVLYTCLRKEGKQGNNYPT